MLYYAGGVILCWWYYTMLVVLYYTSGVILCWWCYTILVVLASWFVQVAAIREGMSLIIPVPLLSLCSGQLFETYVCGSEVVDVAVLKKVVRLVNYHNIHFTISPVLSCFRYRDICESDQLVTWLWQTLESFTNEERLLFLRFVSGRSRLPTNVNDISQRFQIMKWGKVFNTILAVSHLINIFL